MHWLPAARIVQTQSVAFGFPITTPACGRRRISFQILYPHPIAPHFFTATHTQNALVCARVFNPYTMYCNDVLVYGTWVFGTFRKATAR